jgi:hypothetical protein
MLVKEISTLEEMLAQLPLVQQLYPDMTKEKYEEMLRDMIPNNYTQVVVYDGDNCVGLSGIWF